MDTSTGHPREIIIPPIQGAFVLQFRVFDVSDETGTVYRSANPGKADYNQVENTTGWPETRSGEFAITMRFSSEIPNLDSGIRNFIVGITVKVASDEVAFRKEKTYINKLNLALVQVRPHYVPARSGMLTIVAHIDPQARMATQLAYLHHRTRRIIQDEPVSVREQHGHLEALVGRNL